MKIVMLFFIVVLFMQDNVYSQQGLLDRDFGDQGYVLTDFDSTRDFAWAIAVQPDGKIILAGNNEKKYDGFDYAHFALARYHPNGNLDSEFGNNGKLINPSSKTI